MKETRIIMISPGSDITPDQIVRTIHAYGTDVIVKETCYGAVIEGERDDVRKTAAKVKSIQPNALFSKVRAFPIGDPRRCRAQHGTRPGFAQLEFEWKDLDKIEKALDSLERGEKHATKEKPNKLDVSVFRKICEVTK